MKPEQQRIAIAQVCGYLRPHFTPSGSCQANCYEKEDGSFWGTLGVPDYLSDLNAMHEAVKSLPQNLKPRYFACLCTVQGGAISLNGYSEATEATAAQRAEAFLKTLNLWKP